ncbi:cyclohexadienyl dehydratase [Microtetraspora sp. NBRC 13810]|uniref:transporter substrate-binding domain-containing protein n=1 Tax=Microtetraspora sp. NBRC 13810 TaxID=3030990 RepID=UPI0024A551FB|nr:transporter substrate-binding domain-containing protein [Microtetraspora sp. NBRC 13810]GLW09154.1 cyclohexadienyl dehydratase [Microtetraspora sp. NBRC 13810]
MWTSLRTAVLSVLSVLSVVAAGAACTAAGDTPAGSAAPPRGSLLDEVPRAGVLRVCTTGDYRPFTYRDPATGAYRGIDVDMARDLAGSLGARADFVPVTWASLLAQVTAGRCDIAMGGITATLERAREAVFTAPYLEDGKAPIARCEDAGRYTGLTRIDRRGVRVVVNPGGTNETFARTRLRHARVTVFPDNNRIFDEIAAGRADVMITDAAEARYQARLHPELCAVRPDRPLTFAEKAYLMRRGDPDFLTYVDRWLRLRTHDGTYRRFARAWE